jgi:selenium metabolism protein YedF
MKTIDLRQLACPGPVLKLRELLDDGQASVRLQVADDLARSNVSRFAASRGAGVVVEEAEDGSFVLTVTAAAGSPTPTTDERPLADCDAAPTPAGTGPTVVQVSAATMGTGDDELGCLLLRSFIKTQAQLDTPPDGLVFYNGGVRLCCDGSVLIDDLRDLERAGIEILACGTCLNFYGLADHLAVGRVSDMLEIATRLATAGHVVRP